MGDGDRRSDDGDATGALDTALDSLVRVLRDEGGADPNDQRTGRLASVQAIRRLAELEADRPARGAPDHERDAYEHERVAVLAWVAADLVETVESSDHVTEREAGSLEVARRAIDDVYADHSRDAYNARIHGTRLTDPTNDDVR